VAIKNPPHSLMRIGWSVCQSVKSDTAQNSDVTTLRVLSGWDVSKEILGTWVNPEYDANTIIYKSEYYYYHYTIASNKYFSGLGVVLTGIVHPLVELGRGT
jgi:hypothetical protein